MKKLSIFSFIVLLITLVSCEELAGFMNVTFENVEIEEIIDIPLDQLSSPSSRAISLVASSDTSSFIDSLILNMNGAQENDTAEQKIADFLEDISSVSIDTLSIEILENYDSIALPENFEVSVLSVSFFDSDSLIHTETHYNVKPGEEMISPVTAAGLSGISTTLQNNRDLKVVAAGSVVGNRGIDYFALKTRIIADVKTSMSAFTLPE